MYRKIAFLLLLLLPGLASAQPPDDDAQRQQELAKKPQHERLLKGEEAKTAERLEKAIGEQEQKDAYEEAVQLAKELLALRVKVQGADHHEAVAEKFEVFRLEILSARPAEKRREWRNTVRGEAEAQSLVAQGKYAAGFSAIKRYADLCRELFGEDHPATAHSYNNVAYTLYAQGKTAEADPLFQKALDIRRKVLGEDHHDTAASYNNFATNLEAQGKAAEAGPLLQKALEIRRKVLGEDDPETVQSYNNLAMNLNAQGKAAEAGPLLQKALDGNRKALGENHTDTATSYNNVGGNLMVQGKATEAGPFLQKALDIRRKILGDNHPETAQSYNNLAGNLKEQGKAAEAGPLFQNTLEIHRKALGEDHPYTAQSYNNVAMNLNAQGKAAEAGPLLQKALDIRRKVLGEDHPATARSYNNLAYNLDAQGKAAEAQPLYQKALEINRRVLGEDHPDTAGDYNNVAMNLNAQGKAAEAGPLLQKALEVRRKVLGEDHPETASSYNNVAINLGDQGRVAEAGQHYQKALNINRKTLGEDHPDTAQSYNNVAFSLDSLGRTDKARALYQKALEICRKIHGEDHPRTVSVYNELAVTLVAQGNLQQAIAMLSAGTPAFESSRLVTAHGIERANLTQFNPRLLLAALQQTRDRPTAWTQLEFTLARGMLDQQGTGSTDRLTPAEQQDQQAARTRLGAIQPRLLKLVATTNTKLTDIEELNQLLAERRALEATVGRLAVAESERAVEQPDRIRANLPADAALLYWVDVTTKSGNLQEHWACVVRRTGDPLWERLPAAETDGKWSKEDAELPAKLYAALAGFRPQAEVEAIARQLQAQRIAPVLKHLAGIKTLYVVAVHEMAGVPVELLAPQFSVSYVPSGTYLARRGKPLEKPQTLLVLGDPVFPPAKPTVVSTALPPGGLLINQVVPGGAAAKALLKANDVLVSYGGTNVESVEQLSEVMAVKAGEKPVAIQIWREADNKLATYNIPPGRLGVMIAKEPARELIAARRKSDQMLASLTRGEWGELPGSQVELSELAKLFGPQAATTLTRSEASEPALDKLRKAGELAKFRYLHFATHGEANNVRAFDSKLILSQDHPVQLIAAPGEPWFNNELSAQEVLNHWKLDAELVTLSACETALGKNAGGDGMLGFAQAFLLAGSRAVCLSLWKVDDTATTLLMDRFYRNLLGKREDGAQPMGKAAALAEAKTWLKNLSVSQAADRLGVLTDGVSRGSKTGRKVLGDIPAPADASPESKPYAHPKYWAAFILIGDPD